MMPELLQFLDITGKRAMRILRREVYSREDHLVLAASLPQIDARCAEPMREIRKTDQFVKTYHHQLADAFLARGEVGIGYFCHSCAVGFLWIRPGGCVEYVGREAIEIPLGYETIHHFVVAEDFRGRGIGGCLLGALGHAMRTHHFGMLVAFVRPSNAPSLRAFRRMRFQTVGRISSRRVFGFHVVRITSPGVPLRRRGPSDHRSILARAVDFPLRVLTRPTFAKMSAAPMTLGTIGDLPWQSVLSATVLSGSLPAILHSSSTANIPVLLPCCVSPGRSFWKLRVKVEPTGYPVWPVADEARASALIRAVVTACKSRWIESLEWTLPFWINEILEEITTPEGVRLVKVNDQQWILDLHGTYEDVSKLKYHRTARRKIRRARERGVVVTEQPTEEDLREFSGLWASCYHGRRWGGYYLADMITQLHCLGRGAQAILAKVGDKVIGGAVYLDEEYGCVAYCSAIDRRFATFFPKYAILDCVITRLCASGKKYLNLGGTGGRPSLADFKRSWGAEPRPVYRLRYESGRRHFTGPLRLVNAALSRMVSFLFLVGRFKLRWQFARMPRTSSFAAQTSKPKGAESRSKSDLCAHASGAWTICGSFQPQPRD